MKVISIVTGGDYEMHIGSKDKPIILKEGKQYVVNDVIAHSFQQANSLTRNIKVEHFDKYYKRYPGNKKSLKGKTLAAYRTGGAGDILFMTPGLRYLKEKYPDCKIVICTSMAYEDLLTTNPDVDEFHPIPVDLEVFNNADYHILFERVIEENDLAEYENAYDLYLDKLGILLEFKDHYEGKNVIEYMLPTVKLDEEKLEYVKDLLEEAGIKDGDTVIGFHPSSTTLLRNYSFKKSVDLVNFLAKRDYKVVLLGGRGDSDLGDAIRNNVVESHRGNVINFTYHSYDFGYTSAVVSACDVVVGIDSSVLHIAGGLKVPVVGLFGPFNSRLRIGYYHLAVGVQADFRCSPCFVHGPYPCFQAKGGTTSPCLEIISTELIYSYVSEILRITKGGDEKKTTKKKTTKKKK